MVKHGALGHNISIHVGLGIRCGFNADGAFYIGDDTKNEKMLSYMIDTKFKAVNKISSCFYSVFKLCLTSFPEWQEMNVYEIANMSAKHILSNYDLLLLLSL